MRSAPASNSTPIQIADREDRDVGHRRDWNAKRVDLSARRWIVAGRQRRRQRNRDIDHGRNRLERRNDHDKRNDLREFRIDWRHDLPRQRFTPFRRSHLRQATLTAISQTQARSVRSPVDRSSRRPLSLDDWLARNDIGNLLRGRRRASFRCEILRVTRTAISRTQAQLDRPRICL